MTLYLIRHAQSSNNALYEHTGLSTGRVEDPELTALGVEQAGALARHLAEQDREFGFTHLYCSLMVRAVATATAVSQRCGLPAAAWPEVHEQMGIFLQDEQTGEFIGRPGKNRSYFQEHYPELVVPESLNEHGWWNRPVETAAQWTQRAADFVSELLRRHGDSEDRVAVVTHGGFSHVVLMTLTGGAGSDGFWFSMHNTGISRIDFRSSHTAIVYHNRLEHLPAELVS